MVVPARSVAVVARRLHLEAVLALILSAAGLLRKESSFFFSRLVLLCKQMNGNRDSV